MPLVNPFKRPTNIPNTITFTLTPHGKRKAEEYEGNSQSRVLVSLDENGPSNVSAICEDTGLSRGKVAGVLLKAQKQVLVHSIRGDTE